MKAPSFLETIELRHAHTEVEPLSRSYDREDTSYEPSKRSIQRATTWRTRFSGWRGGALVCIAIVSLVLLLNVVLAIITATAWATKEGVSTAYMGDCAVASRTTTALHLLINLLSSLLLGASNYCMQRLVAPTRKEIDEAHAKKKWLDIGVPSVRNLASISRGRLAIWVLLGVSSVPLHFVYNSVVFETIAANQVKFLAVTPEFFTDKSSWSWNGTDGTQPVVFNSTWDNEYTRLQNMLLGGQYLNKTRFENITSDECVSRYGARFITSGSGFGVPVASQLEAWGAHSNSSVFSSYQEKSGEIDVNVFGTTSGQKLLDYCLSEIVPSKCQVQFSQTILWIVIACNTCKVMLMVLILRKFDSETIVTIGDAIQSFLLRPDLSTQDCCLMSRHTAEKVWKIPELRQSQYYRPPHRQRWGTSCSRRRWGTSLSLYLIALLTSAALFFYMQLNSTSGPSMQRNSFGKVDPSYLIDVQLPFASSVIPYILLANLPQAVASFVYLTYNGMFTCMLANREWTQYGIKRARLRVTMPTTSQRSTHFLQLPYTFSIPLLIGGVLLHWFISQSIFLARIAVYQDGKLVEDDRLKNYEHIGKGGNQAFTGIGFSDAAFIASLVWGGLIILIMLIVSNVMVYPKGVPVGGTNSAVISAACHVRYEGDPRHQVMEEDDIVSRPLKWGVTIRGGRGKIGHCCFSAGKVEPPNVGHLYAGDVLKRKKS